MNDVLDWTIKLNRQLMKLRYQGACFGRVIHVMRGVSHAVNKEGMDAAKSFCLLFH